jgi:hypothetical protein
LVVVKLENQRDFTQWWTVNVGVRRGSGRGKAGIKNADLRSLTSMASAEAEGKAKGRRA